MSKVDEWKAMPLADQLACIEDFEWCIKRIGLLNYPETQARGIKGCEALRELSGLEPRHGGR